MAWSHRSTRDRPAKAPLSVEVIVDAALAILSSEGLTGLSMRRVAAALDTSAGALYVYFASRHALLVAVFDRIITTVELRPPEPSRWRDQLHSLLVRLRDALVSHPGIAASTMINPPQTEAALDLLENLLGILLAGGLDAQDAAWTADIMAAQITYAAVEAESRDPGALADEVTANLARLPADRYPLITAHAVQLVAGNADERFRFAIDAVTDSALARASRTPSATPGNRAAPQTSDM
ncbi:MAG: TetR/AcrR family transcriptional regulator C-terminal domain-containing protein [Jatrophihabitantaceae bacterium]